MGKSFPINKTRLNQLTQTASQVVSKTAKQQIKPTSRTQRPGELRAGGEQLNGKMENSNVVIQNINNSNCSNSSETTRLPLSEVVSDCVKRWFRDTLKEAKAGDINMQVLLGQMYYSGYGVARDAQKGRIWMTRASRTRSSVWKVSDKHPGYNASDSDSDEMKGES